MKHTLSAKALKVLRAIARGRPKANAAYRAGRERYTLTIGSKYELFVRSIAGFRAGAEHTVKGRVVLEIFPGFAANEALGFDLDGKVWVAQQDECNDWAAPLTAKYFKDIPGMNPMVGHLIRLVEMTLLALTPEQVKFLNKGMRATTELPFGRRPGDGDEDIPF